jgi:hypothetical protein
MRKMSPSELNPARNEHHRKWTQLHRETILIILVSISMIAAVISWVRSESAIEAANKANSTAETWQTMYKETERECRLAQMEIDDFRIIMVKSGLDIDHIGEKP